MPHAERANTACFLEEVIKYIDSLKKRNHELEQLLKDTGNNGAIKASSQQQEAQQQQRPSVSDAQEQLEQLRATESREDLAGTPGPIDMPAPAQSGASPKPPAASNPLPGAGLQLPTLNLGAAGNPNLNSLLEQALLQGALSQAAAQAQQISQVLNQVQAQHALAAAALQQQQQQQVPLPGIAAAAPVGPSNSSQTAAKKTYGSTLPPDLQKLLQEAADASPAAPGEEGGSAPTSSGTGTGAAHAAIAALAAASGTAQATLAGAAASAAGQGNKGEQDADGRQSSGSRGVPGAEDMSEEGGVPLKKRKVLVL